MALDRRKAFLLGAAAVLRLLLFVGFPSLPELLAGRVEISTPVNGFKRLQEGVFLYTRHVSPYDGGVYHQAPLFLPLFAAIPSAISSAVVPLLYITLDLLCGSGLMQIAQRQHSGNERLYQSPRKGDRMDELAVGAAYLLNPLTIAACLGRSTSVFTSCTIIFAVLYAIDRKTLSSMTALAFASYLSMYPILLLPPLVILSFDQVARTQKSPPGVSAFIASCLAGFSGVSAALLALSFLITDFSWEFLASTYGNHLLVTDLTPNSGLWWYFLIEMFDPFRGFFLSVFWLHLASYVAGFCIRLRSQPLFGVVAMLGVFAIFKPYPSISDAALFVCFLMLYQHVFPLMRYPFFATAALCYAVFLGPAFYYLWIYAGSGNANFFYAITLVWSLGLSVLMVDAVWAVLRDEFEVERPELKGKYVKQL